MVYYKSVWQAPTPASSTLDRENRSIVQTITADKSQKIKNMSLLCSFLVVSIHIPWTHDIPLSCEWLIYEGVKRGVARIAVPFFFIVSGFFLAQHFSEDGWLRREIRKRIKSLAIPYICWSIIAFAAPVLLNIAADLIANRPFGTSIYFLNNANWLQILSLDVTNSPYLVTLWYVRCLFLLILTSSVIEYLIRKLDFVWLMISFIFLLAFSHIPNENLRHFFEYGYAANGLFYFSIGIFLCKHRISVKPTKFAVLAGVIGLSLLGIKLVFSFRNWIGTTMLEKFSIPFLLYCTWHFMSTAKWPLWATSCSFPIFLMHPIFLCYLEVISRHLPLNKLTQDLIGFCMAIFGTIIVTLLLRKFMPKTASLLFGGR